MNEWLIITLYACLCIPITQGSMTFSTMNVWNNWPTRMMLVIQRSVNGISNQEWERQATKAIAFGYCHVWTLVWSNISVYVYTNTHAQTYLYTKKQREKEKFQIDSILFFSSMFQFAFDRILIGLNLNLMDINEWCNTEWTITTVWFQPDANVYKRRKTRTQK